MNPGVSGEVGKVATSTIDALKSAPAVLALVIFNVLFLGFIIYTAVSQGERWDREIERWAAFARTCQDVTIREKSP